MRIQQPPANPFFRGPRGACAAAACVNVRSQSLRMSGARTSQLRVLADRESDEDREQRAFVELFVELLIVEAATWKREGHEDILRDGKRYTHRFLPAYSGFGNGTGVGSSFRVYAHKGKPATGGQAR